MTTALNEGQSQAIKAIRAFLCGPASCFILRGSAGTGKTTLIAALVKELGTAQRSFHLITPTGRAARILAAKTEKPAETIHRVIYGLAPPCQYDVRHRPSKSNERGQVLH